MVSIILDTGFWRLYSILNFILIKERRSSFRRAGLGEVSSKLRSPQCYLDQPERGRLDNAASELAARNGHAKSRLE